MSAGASRWADRPRRLLHATGGRRSRPRVARVPSRGQEVAGDLVHGAAGGSARRARPAGVGARRARREHRRHRRDRRGHRRRADAPDERRGPDAGGARRDRGGVRGARRRWRRRAREPDDRRRPTRPRAASRRLTAARPDRRLMPRRQPTPPTVAVHVVVDDTPDVTARLAARLAELGGSLRTLSTVRRLEAEGGDGSGALAGAELEIEVEGIDESTALAALDGLDAVRSSRLTRAMDRVFGKRVIVVGGGAQVAQVALGAVSEADRHNLRGERISVDTIPLVGEANIAAAVRAVADLPRARLLVLAGSIMGGDITRAAQELRAVGIPIIALNMVGSITEAVDLVVSDPVQAGTMAVMAIADTATFDLARQRGRRL